MGKNGDFKRGRNVGPKDFSAEPPVPAGVGSLREREPLAPVPRMGYGEPATGGAAPGAFTAISTQPGATER